MSWLGLQLAQQGALNQRGCSGARGRGGMPVRRVSRCGKGGM